MQEKQDYYVYTHRRVDTGVVFYVGSGRANRCRDTSSRSKEWKSIVDESIFEVEYLAQNLSKGKARLTEEDFINNPKEDWRLVNHKIPTNAKQIDYDLISETFYYDETSPSCLRWKKDVYRLPGIIAVHKDSVAGNNHVANGKIVSMRVKLKVDGIRHHLKVHRIIWCLFNKEFHDDLVIDHIDGNPTNNRIGNLRQVTSKKNARNRKMPERVGQFNGIVGVTKKNGGYYAEIGRVDGKRVTKSFAVSKYGDLTAFYLACKARYEYLVSLPEDQSFSELHSKSENLLEVIHNYENNYKN